MGCPSGIRISNAKFFSPLNKAKTSTGFRPCGACRP
ncbi:MAG TPA: hypothetical protein DCW42_01420 [Bacteroidetes bacterium]|nr:hypothetical protein [Bacteroidota bacterium]